MTDKAISYPDDVMELARIIYEAHGYSYEGRTVLTSGAPYGPWLLAVAAAKLVADRSRRDPGLTAEVERLREALERYADHDDGCVFVLDPYLRPKCTCGYSQAVTGRLALEQSSRDGGGDE